MSGAKGLPAFVMVFGDKVTSERPVSCDPVNIQPSKFSSYDHCGLLQLPSASYCLP